MRTISTTSKAVHNTISIGTNGYLSDTSFVDCASFDEIISSASYSSSTISPSLSASSDNPSSEHTRQGISSHSISSQIGVSISDDTGDSIDISPK